MERVERVASGLLIVFGSLEVRAFLLVGRRRMMLHGVGERGNLYNMQILSVCCLEQVDEWYGTPERRH